MLKYTNSIPKIVCAYKNVHIYHKHTQIREREVVCPHCIYQSVTVVINYGKVRFETNFTFIIFFREVDVSQVPIIYWALEQVGTLEIV